MAASEPWPSWHCANDPSRSCRITAPSNRSPVDSDSSRQVRAIAYGGAACELEGPRITGPRTSFNRLQPFIVSQDGMGLSLPQCPELVDQYTRALIDEHQFIRCLEEKGTFVDPPFGAVDAWREEAEKHIVVPCRLCHLADCRHVPRIVMITGGAD